MAAATSWEICESDSVFSRGGAGPWPGPGGYEEEPSSARTQLSEFHWSVGPGNSGPGRWFVEQSCDGEWTLWVEAPEADDSDIFNGRAVGWCRWPEATPEDAGFFLLEEYFFVCLSSSEPPSCWLGFDSLSDLSERAQQAYGSAELRLKRSEKP